jgi:hypothetical protein
MNEPDARWDGRQWVSKDGLWAWDGAGWVRMGPVRFEAACGREGWHLCRSRAGPQFPHLVGTCPRLGPYGSRLGRQPAGCHGIPHSDCSYAGGRPFHFFRQLVSSSHRSPRLVVGSRFRLAMDRKRRSGSGRLFRLATAGCRPGDHKRRPTAVRRVPAGRFDRGSSKAMERAFCEVDTAEFDAAAPGGQGNLALPQSIRHVLSGHRRIAIASAGCGAGQTRVTWSAPKV